MARTLTLIGSNTVNYNAPVNVPTFTGTTNGTLTINTGANIVTVNGTNFVAGMSINLGALGIFPLTFIDAVSATFTIDPGDSLNVGAYSGTLTGPTGTSNAITTAIDIICSSKAITTAVPAFTWSIAQGGTLNVTINGTGFDPQDTIALSDGVNTLTVTAVTFVNTTQMTCTITAGATQALGNYQLVIGNPNCNDATANNALTVTGMGVTCVNAPTGFTMTPNYIPSGQTVTVTLIADGANEFDDGMTFTLPVGFTSANLNVIDGQNATVDITAP